MDRAVSVTTALASISVGETVRCGNYSIQRTASGFFVSRGKSSVPVPATATTVGDACQIFSRAVERASLGTMRKVNG